MAKWYREHLMKNLRTTDWRLLIEVEDKAFFTNGYSKVWIQTEKKIPHRHWYYDCARCGEENPGIFRGDTFVDKRRKWRECWYSFYCSEKCFNLDLVKEESECLQRKKHQEYRRKTEELFLRTKKAMYWKDRRALKRLLKGYKMLLTSIP